MPIAFSARVLPADATGTLTFYVDSIPVQTSTIAAQTPGDYIAIGDSITYAAYIGDPAQRYQNILAQPLGLNVSTYASPGYTACDTLFNNVMPKGVGTSVTSNPLYSLEVGANDMLYYGVGANEALFELCHQAALSWLGIARANKVLIGDPQISILSGAWTSAPAFGNATQNALTNSTGSGTVRFQLSTYGGAAYLWYLLQANIPGSFAVSVDGTPMAGSTSTLFPAGTPETIAGSYAVLRIPVAAGAHTFDISAQSGSVGVFGMGTAPPVSPSSIVPTVLVTDVPSQASTYAAAQAEYNADIRNDIALLGGDGLDLRFVPTEQYWLADSADTTSFAHPNQLGLAEFAQAFQSVLSSTGPVNDSISVAGASFTTSTLASGAHGITVSYSGDAKYASGSTGMGLVLYDATSVTTLSSTGTLFPVKTPITLTAAVANASGLVNFIDTSSGGNVLLGSAWMAGAPSVSITVPSLSAAQHTIVAQFQGDVFNAPSSSAPLIVTVLGPYSTTTLSAPATRYFAASPVVLTATVAPALATGSVTFFDGSTVLGQATLVSGSATFSTSSLTPGIHTLTAGYNGNTTQNASTSPALAVEIDTNPTTLAIAPVPASIAYGTPVTLAASVSPASASGTVALADTFVALGQSGAVTQNIPLPALANGGAAVVSSSLAPGSHTFTAIYAGDTDDLPSVSSPVTTRVTLAPSSTTLAPVPANLTYGNALTLTAAVTPAAATGSITFTDSVGGTLAQLPLVNGTASFSSSTLAPGSHSFSAAYAGDSFRAASTSPALATTIAPVVSSLALAASATTVYAGNPLTLTATLTPAAATGSVVFRDATLGVLGQSPVVKGVATLTVSSLALGAYSITAAYSGDVDDTQSSSAAITAQVTLTPTTTVLSATPNPAAYGAPVTLSASVTPGTATGSVVFTDGAGTLGTALLVAGKASLTSSTLAVGSHALRAVYSGDALNAASSATLAETVSASSTSTSLTLAQAVVIANSSATVNVRIASTNTTPSGTVILRSGATVLATSPVANATTGAGYATLSFNAEALGLGTFPLIASYSGDADDLPSDSSATPAALAVNGIPTSASLSLSAFQIAIDGSITLSASVASASGTPTGSMVFSSNGQTLGTSALGAGTATLRLTATAMGSLPIVATYTPAGLFAASASAPQTLLVTAPLTAALSPSTMQAAPGTTSAATLLLTPLSGFTGAIQTACASSQTFVQCSVSAPAAITSSAPLSVPVQIIIAKNTAAISRPAGAVFALLLPGVLALRWRRRLGGSRRVLCAILVLGVASICMAGCAPDGGTFNSIPPGAQAVTVTVTAAGVSTAATLTVNVAD